MKKITNFFNLNNIIKILIIFLIGFTYRILIYHCLGINVFLDYTHSISILYYLSLSSFSVYIDQLFSFQYIIPINIEPTNNVIKSFDDNLKSTLLFNKDSTSKLPLHQKIRCKLSWYSLGKDKNAFTTYEEYKLTWDRNTSIWIDIKNLVKWSVHWTNNESTGNTDLIWQELEERRRKRRDLELERRAFYTRLSWKKEK